MQPAAVGAMVTEDAATMAPDMVELILANVADGVFTVDPDFNITYFNPAAEEITGFSGAEALGRPCFEIFRTPLCGQACPMRRSIRSRQKISNFEIDILTSTRKRRTVSVSTAPLVDSSGGFVGGVETFRDLSALKELRRAVRERYTFEDIVAKSEPMRHLVAALPNIAHSSAPVLVEGEAGTGKELVATAIHNAGPRKDGPLVRVGCGAFPDALLEAELFGAGARTGRIDAAERGTLLLDDVADIPLTVQARLLRAIEAAEGGKNDERARLIAATKHDLNERVRAGQFREDLFYRLSVVVLRLPPLVERSVDIPPLVGHVIDRLNLRLGRSIQGVTDTAMAVLLRHPFPGNVRELENAIEHAYIVAQGSRISATDLPPHLKPTSQLGSAPPAPSETTAERDELCACLERNHWRVPRAAAELGVHRTTLWRRLKRLGIEPPR